MTVTPAGTQMLAALVPVALTHRRHIHAVRDVPGAQMDRDPGVGHGERS